MPLQATSGAASYDAFGGGVPVAINYIEDVFSTWLYTGTGANGLQIQNGIDLAGKGGLVFGKARSGANAGISDWGWVDTVRGGSSVLYSNTTDAAQSTALVSSFNADGFTLNGEWPLNFYGSPYTYGSWTFRKQPKFFDVVTWTGNGTGDREIPHNLGSAPGCIILKSTSAGGTNWLVYHRALSTPDFRYIYLNDTSGALTSGDNLWNVTSTTFRASSTLDANNNGATYVAYLFAHNAGGFGLTGTDNVISCGSFTTDGAGDASVNLGYEPQWLTFKSSDFVQDWYTLDTMRGFTAPPAASAQTLRPNTSAAESNYWSGVLSVNSTGFQIIGTSASKTYIYIAIRRGPMKVPTSGTSVFNAIARTGTGAAATVTGVGFPLDLLISQGRVSGNIGNYIVDRMRGRALALRSSGSTSADQGPSSATQDVTSLASMDGFSVGTPNYTSINTSGQAEIDWSFKRAPSVFDIVCYTGSNSDQTVAHNLAVLPELVIFKKRSSSGGWGVSFNFTSTNQSFAQLSLTDAAGDDTYANVGWMTQKPTSTSLFLSVSNIGNVGGATYVAYLFATCAGVSKIFSYTGNGSSQTINCGFTGGARFILIKRTDSTGDWYVWDTVRGIVAGNDPHLSLNSATTEVTSNDTIDTDSTGFVVNQVSATNVNVSSATYIGLAIA